MSLKRLLSLIVYLLYFNNISFTQITPAVNKKEQNILIASGLVFSKSKLFDPQNFLKTKYTESFSINASFQKQFSKRLFWEVNFSVNDYWVGFRINDNNPAFLGSSNPAFISLEGSYGFIYKFQTKENENILNLHIGFNIGYAFSSKGFSGNIGYFNNMTGQNIINELEGKINQHSLLILGNSIGLSKGFRIANNFDIGFNLSYNFGYNKLTEIDIEYSTTSNSEINQARVILSGTYWRPLIYLKYKINNHK